MEGDGLWSRSREWMTTPAGKVVSTLVALAAMGAAATILIVQPGAGDAERSRLRSAGRKVLYYCQACKATGPMTVPINKKRPDQFGDQFPRKCPKCGEKQAVLGMQCSACRKIFKQPPESQKLYNCTRCGQVYDLRMGGPAAPRGTGTRDPFSRP
ncbi:hypothetical protein LCGC14_2236650 [marine sediment metagenome]|uniref:Uncharacterized protein n=1 Tax=marine sediment metagenome TaxID=412755 RepID=A0A0F9D6X1_9ZZZZ